MVNERSCSRISEGLDLSNTSLPVLLPAGTLKTSSASKGTKFSVIHSPWAIAIAVASKLSFTSYHLTGKSASKYQNPIASPVTLKGDCIISPAIGL